MRSTLASSVRPREKSRPRWTSLRDNHGASAVATLPASASDNGATGDALDGTVAVAGDFLRLDVVLPGLEGYDLIAIRRHTGVVRSVVRDDPQETYHVGPIEIDLRAQIVRRHGVMVSLPPKCMAVLAALARSRGRVMSRTELLREVWAGAWVQERVVDTAIWHLRKLLEDDPMRPRWIATAKKSGYRLAHPREW